MSESPKARKERIYEVLLEALAIAINEDLGEPIIKELTEGTAYFRSKL